MTTLPYAIIAVLMILVVVLLVREARTDEPTEAPLEREDAQGRWDEQFLNLSERIFDPADYFWLRHDLGHPHLARALARSRKRLALRWLRALKTSFDELIRTPDPAFQDGEATPRPASWHLLWLTLRFHFLLGYALWVVQLFGPYHRLIPPFAWVHGLPHASAGRGRFGTAVPSNLE